MSTTRNNRKCSRFLALALTLALAAQQSCGKPMFAADEEEDYGGVGAINQLSTLNNNNNDNADFLARRQVRKEAKSAAPLMDYVMFKAKPPVELGVQEGGKAVLECDVAGTPMPMITWWKNGSPIKLNTDKTSNQESGPSGRLSLSRVKSRLFLDCLGPADSGATFTCVASTPYKQIYATTKVQVLKKSATTTATNGGIEAIAPAERIAAVVAAVAAAASNKENEYYASPNSIELSKELYGLETAAMAATCLAKKSHSSPARIYFWTHTTLENIGTDGVIHCRAIGSPSPVITWYGPSDEQLVLGAAAAGADAKYRLLSSGDLLIRNVTFEDMGKYRCEAQNQHGSDSADKMFLYPTEPVKAE